MCPLPEALLERLKNRQAILVTGLGCSALADLPAWPALVEQLADRIPDDERKQEVRELLHARHVTTALALCRELVSQEAIVEVLQEVYPVAAQVPESLRAIAKAPWRGIIATGQDAIWTTALAGEADLAERVVFAANVPVLHQGRGRFLVQLFGRADVPASLCLAPREIGPALVATGAVDYLETLHKKWSFVFLGFAPDDPDLDLLAGRILARSPSMLEHFFVAPALTDLNARRIRAEFGLVPVAMEGGLEDVCATLTQACNLAGEKPAVDDGKFRRDVVLMRNSSYREYRSGSIRTIIQWGIQRNGQFLGSRQ